MTGKDSSFYFGHFYNKVVTVIFGFETRRIIVIVASRITVRTPEIIMILLVSMVYIID